MSKEICLHEIKCEVVHTVEGSCHPRTCPEAKRLAGKQCPDPVGEVVLPIHNKVFRDPRDRRAKRKNRK
jgi:hypothetical protein